MPTYYCILTNTGQNKIAAAQSGGPALNLTQFAVGDSGGAYFEPLATQVSLVNELWRGSINRIYVHPNNANWMVVEAIIPAASGGFDIREAGIFDDVGDLIAVGKYPLTNKPAPGSGSEKDLYVRMILQVTNAASVAQTIDPSVVMATKEYVDSRDWRESVRAATVGGNINGSAAPSSLDGVALAAGDRTLVKDQTAPAENGIYVVQTVGTGADGIWVRSLDADSSLEVTANFTVAVEEGTVNADSLWMLTTNQPITLGTTGLTFKRMIGKTGVTAGDYTKVTVDDEGRVTAGQNPTTLAGYGIIDAWSTGDVKITFKTVPDVGWVMADDGTIGNSSSGATNRANADCESLFKLLWNNVDNAWAPVFDNTGTPVVRGANADADWVANRRIQVGTILGRALGVAGAGAGLTLRQLGETLGEETHLLTIAEMPSHSHDIGVNDAYGAASISWGNSAIATRTTEPEGGGQPHNNMQPTVFLKVMIKL